MQRIALVIAFASLTGAASAQSRLSTTQLACPAAQSVVQSQGAVVLGTGGDTFDRFVRDQSFCPRGQITKATFVPTATNPQCMVGYRCVEPSFSNQR